MHVTYTLPKKPSVNKMAGSSTPGSLNARKLFSSNRDMWNLTIDDCRRIVSPRPPSPCRRKSTDVVRMSKSELERRDSAARQLAEDNARLSSRIRCLEQDLLVLKQVEQDYCTLGAQVGVNLDSVSTETARAAIADAVAEAVEERERTYQKLMNVSEQVTALSGALAAEKTDREGVSAELDQLKSASREKESIIRQQQEDIRALRQSSANLSAQLESLRRRMESREEEGGNALRPIPVVLQELKRLREEVVRGALEVGDLGDQLKARGEQLELAVEHATTSQDALMELIEGVSDVLGMSVEDSTPGECVKQVAAVCQENTELRAVVGALKEAKATCEVGARANRETILRMVAEAKEYESTLDKMTSLKQERDAAVACKVSAEHERDELMSHLSRVQEQLAAAENRLQEEEQHKDALREELHRLEEALEKQKEEYACLMGQIHAATHSDSSEPGAALQALALKAEELESVLGQVSSMESIIQSQMEELASMRSAVEERDRDVEASQAHLKAAEEQLEACRANARLLEASAAEAKQALQVHVEFGIRLATCLGLDEAVSVLLSGEFACDAIITRAQQLARQETKALLEKQAIVHRLQQRLKVSKQALDSKELHNGILQKKITSLQERITSYNSMQSRVDSLEKKLKMRCSQEEKLRSELAHWSTAEHDLKDKERSVLQLKDTVKAQEATIAILQCSMGQLSKERDAVVKELDVLRMKGSKQREGLEQCRAELEVEMRACQDKLGQLNKTQQQYVSLREGLSQALGMSQGQASDDQALIEATENLSLALRRQEQCSYDMETSLRQLEQGFMLGLQGTLSQLYKPEM